MRHRHRCCRNGCGKVQFFSFLFLESRQNFMAGYECLRSNDQIDYRPLNLNIILHESDITYNLALCCLAMENIEDFKSFVNSALETAQVWAIPYG